MLGHCLRRSPNFNPSMGLNASCFLVLKKTPASHITRISLASFIRSHAFAPASQTVGQRYRRWASINQKIGSMLRACCAIRLIKCPYIAYRASP